MAPVSPRSSRSVFLSLLWSVAFLYGTVACQGSFDQASSSSTRTSTRTSLSLANPMACACRSLGFNIKGSENCPITKVMPKSRSAKEPPKELLRATCWMGLNSADASDGDGNGKGDDRKARASHALFPNENSANTIQEQQNTDHHRFATASRVPPSTLSYSISQIPDHLATSSGAILSLAAQEAQRSS